jgi:hypothetical protein
MNPVPHRWWFYLGSLGLTIGASIWVTVKDPDHEPAPARVRRIAAIAPARLEEQPPAAAFVLPVREFPEPSVLEGDHNPFAMAGNVAVAPPPAPPPAAPPSVAAVPAVPPLPFAYRGVLKDSAGAWIVQLSRGKDYLSAGPGEVIDSDYRLDDMSADELRFTYLPMSTVQILPITSDPPQ